jgi:hypothetical protein
MQKAITPVMAFAFEDIYNPFESKRVIITRELSDTLTLVTLMADRYEPTDKWGKES